jgi:hypothetical protein
VVRAKISAMEKVIRVFDSFEAADAADAAEEFDMTPERRIAIVLELRERYYPDATQQGLARVCRIINLEQS